MDSEGRIHRLGVLGWPVRHSRSPAMQRAAIAALRLDGYRYQLLPVPPELFAETVRALGAAGFVGANVTVPHKPAALALADSATAAARAIGAANTLSLAAGGAIEAANTDAPGLLAALGVELAGGSAVVLGAGGSARAAVWALREAGAEVAVWSRDPARARALADAMGVAAIARPHSADVLVNATTVGMDEHSTADALRSLALDADLIQACAHVVDLPYSSVPTPLVSAARELGVAVVDGLDVLVAQGALSFELWTGLRAPLAAMERAARAA
jgi:shikimate dehydrogenase